MEGFERTSDNGESKQNSCGSVLDAGTIGNTAEDAFAARVEQWHEQALRHPDDRQACIGAITSGLAGIVHTHQMVIKRGIENCNTNLLEAPAIQEAFAAHTGLLRQLHSMMSFEARLEQMHTEKSEALGELNSPRRRPR